MPNDFADRAIARMRAPGQMHIICVDITNKCDLKCSNCTRLLANQDRLWDMSLDNFRHAVRSLRDFPGIIAVIGGNPCMHRDFEGICRVMAEEIPEKIRRGLWTNNAFKFAELAEQTFGTFNLNPHGVARGIASLERLKNRGVYYEGHSEHSSLLAAVKDFHEPEEMWDRIANCDINKNWSASIVENKGKLRAYFCEVAASFDLARGTDNGIEVTDGWWRRPLDDFSHQIRHFCPGCGVPARIKGHMDHEEIDTYSRTNADLAERSALTKKRKVVEVTRERSARADHAVTTYSTNLATTPSHAILKVGVVTPYYREKEEVLRACHESVAAQSYACTHYMVADGYPRPEISGWAVKHTTLPNGHEDNGNYARWIGAMAAIADGCQAIAFLDADNWFAPEHIAGMIQLHHTTGAAVCTSGRAIHHLDGSYLAECDESDGKSFVDTSCLLCTEASFPVLNVWGAMPRTFSPVNDRVFWAAVRARGLSTAHLSKPTVMFRSKYPFHYKRAGIVPPPESARPERPSDSAWLNLPEENKWMIFEGNSDATGRFYRADGTTATRLKRGRELLGSNHAAAAAAVYLAILKTEPLQIEAMHNLAIAWLNSGRHADAERLLRMVVAAEPDNKIFRNNLNSVLAAKQ